MRPAKRTVIIMMATLVGLALAVPAVAFDANWYQNFVQNKAFKCIHPKSKIQKIEVVVPPKVDKNVETCRVKVFYKGWVKKHQMILEVSTTTIGGKPNAKVNILSDTGSLKRLKCALTQGWQPIQ
jgi:hypothetical protein